MVALDSLTAVVGVVVPLELGQLSLHWSANACLLKTWSLDDVQLAKALETPAAPSLLAPTVRGERRAD